MHSEALTQISHNDRQCSCSYKYIDTFILNDSIYLYYFQCAALKLVNEKWVGHLDGEHVILSSHHMFAYWWRFVFVFSPTATGLPTLQRCYTLLPARVHGAILVGHQQRDTLSCS